MSAHAPIHAGGHPSKHKQGILSDLAPQILDSRGELQPGWAVPASFCLRIKSHRDSYDYIRSTEFVFGDSEATKAWGFTNFIQTDTLLLSGLLDDK